MTNAKKENEFIYHDRVPGNEELSKDLEVLSSVVLVQTPDLPNSHHFRVFVKFDRFLLIHSTRQ